MKLYLPLATLPQLIALTIVLTLSQTLGFTIAAAELTYESDVRPILKTHCFHCHGEGGELEAGLDLRLRRLIAKGGESGAAIVAGSPQKSLLLQRLHDGDMPPSDVKLRPTASEIATIEKWIASGAAASQPEPDDLDPNNYITAAERSFWSFQPVRSPAVPIVQDTSRVRTPVDSFITAKLQESGLTLSADASAEAIVRRVYFDLTGLPPAPAEVDAYVNDKSPGAYERLLDRALASPRYGERWGRHWLDVAGYADSEGYTADDSIRPYAWKYRDYVINAFNTDKPYNDFVIEQLAGDELVTQPFTELPHSDVQKLTATGFLRMAPDGTGSRGVEQNVARNDVVARTLEIVSTSLLGLTVACAQCHNHRYDPILQEDYYAMRAIFEPSLNPNKWLPPARRRVSLFTAADREKAAAIEARAKKVLDERNRKQNEFIEATVQRELAKLKESIRGPVLAARNTEAKKRTAAQKKLLKEHPSINVTSGSLYLYDKKAADELKKYVAQAKAIRAAKPKQEFIRAVWETPGTKLPVTRLFHRGDHEQPKQQVPPRELTVLSAGTPVVFSSAEKESATSGRRLSYARWLTRGEHPLLARVMVNRIWLNHFGRGLVTSPGDFGSLGVAPTHPALLDYLASEFVRNGWSIKKMHRLIMTSTAYRQSSQRNQQGDTADSTNSLYWRMPVRRLDAESLRDAVLQISGELNNKTSGPAVPVMADRAGRFVVGIENLNAGRPGPVIKMQGEDLRRSIYIQSRRSRPLSVLAPFDLPRMEPNCTSRNASTVSSQSLMLMNSDFVIARTGQFARKLQKDHHGLRDQIAAAWKAVYAAEPTKAEVAAAVEFIEAQTIHFRDHASKPEKGKPAADPATDALANFCHVLLSSNRFLYID